MSGVKPLFGKIIDMIELLMLFWKLLFSASSDIFEVFSDVFLIISL